MLPVFLCLAQAWQAWSSSLQWTRVAALPALGAPAQRFSAIAGMDKVTGTQYGAAVRGCRPTFLQSPEGAKQDSASMQY